MEKFFTLIVLIILAVFMVIFILIRVEKFDDTDPKLFEILNNLRKVDSSAAAKIKLSRGKKSYTINKQVVYLCLYDKDGNYYDDNTLMYVSLHELAHVKNKEIGHTNGFHKIFNEYLDRAQSLKLFDRKKDIPDNYCLF